MSGDTPVDENFILRMVAKFPDKGMPAKRKLTIKGGDGAVLLLGGKQVKEGSEVEVAGRVLDARVKVGGDGDLPVAVLADGEVVEGVGVDLLEQQPVVNLRFPDIGTAAGGDLVTLQGIG